MKKYTIKSVHGCTEFRANQAPAAANLLALLAAEDTSNVAFWLDGKPSTLDALRDSANEAKDAWFAERTEISWRTGDCENTRRYNWIKN